MTLCDTMVSDSSRLGSSVDGEDVSQGKGRPNPHLEIMMRASCGAYLNTNRQSDKNHITFDAN